MATRRERGAYHHGNLRGALLDEAERALARKGEDALALRAVARAVGVSHAAAYHHFADRDALLRAVAARGFERFAAALSAGAQSAAGDRSFLEMGVAYVRFAVDHPSLFRLMFGPKAARGRHADEALVAASERAFEVLLGGVRRLHREDDEAAVRARAVAAWSFVHGLAALLLDGQLEHAGFSARDAEDAARTVLGGGAMR
jgi:AcrR family transcriptional regulator